MAPLNASVDHTYIARPRGCIYFILIFQAAAKLSGNHSFRVEGAKLLMLSTVVEREMMLGTGSKFRYEIQWKSPTELEA
jgi:hypothetical protein